jgi:hypothetical protein
MTSTFTPAEFGAENVEEAARLHANESDTVSGAAATNLVADPEFHGALSVDCQNRLVRHSNNAQA